MTRVLLATASVHTTAAACDYLAGRLAPGDEVIALSVVDGPVDARDAADALNVVSVRLPDAAVETVQPTGDPGSEILSLARRREVDEIVIGARRGEPGRAEGGLGSTVGTVLASAERPVVVLPTADPDAT